MIENESEDPVTFLDPNTHTRNKPATVRNRQLQSRRGSPLIVTRRVIRHPDQNAGHAGVHPRGHEKSHSILDERRVNIGNSGITDNGDWERDKHDDPSEAKSI